MSSFSIHLMLKSSGIVGIRAYEQLGYRAFGTPGKMAAAIAIALQNVGGYLGSTSGFSLSCMVFFLVAVIYKKFQIPCPFEDFSVNSTSALHSLNISSHSLEHNSALVHEDEDSYCEASLFTINSKTVYTIPIMAFAFSCHPEVLPIYTELRNPTKKRMQQVSNISILVMYTMYLLAALFGYLTFYGKVEPELLHTYNRIDPYDTLILCVRVATLIAVTLTVPILLFPVRRAIQHILFPTKSFSWLRHIAIALVLLTLMNMMVIFAPNILGIFGIIGATSSPCLIFIFPAVFYLRIVPKEDEPMSSVPKILAVCFAVVGISFMVMSLSFILIDWTMGSSNAGGGH
ncbi:sodium-coupled neutral amino acid transporter 3-like [Scomber scombrus]|uniref:Sodium-coupled neutral amino acid transporter 3-like n=1 Tax=Scomber scombrus TaxID=13677 RepID=A0AAV1MZH0_SCOSC